MNRPTGQSRNDMSEDGAERGASLVEFALILPVFALLLFALIDFGLAFGGWTAMRSGVAAGARAASVDYVDPSCALASNPMICTVEKRIGSLVGTTGTVAVSLALPKDSNGNSGQVGDPVEVCATAALTSSTGLTAPFLDGRSIHSISEVRLEQTPGTWANGLPNTLPSTC